MKILEIINSRFKYKKLSKEDFYKKRYAICMACPFNSSKKKYSNILKTVFYGVLNFFNTSCTICGCGIKYKVSVKTARCSLIEIDKEPKWERILK